MKFLKVVLFFFIACWVISASIMTIFSSDALTTFPSGVINEAAFPLLLLSSMLSGIISTIFLLHHIFQTKCKYFYIIAGVLFYISFPGIHFLTDIFKSLGFYLNWPGTLSSDIKFMQFIELLGLNLGSVLIAVFLSIGFSYFIANLVYFFEFIFTRIKIFMKKTSQK